MRSRFCQVPSCNLFTQHVSYLLWRDTTSELWTPVHSFTLIIQPTAIIVSFHSLQLNIIFHTIRLIFCYSKPGRLTTFLFRWGKVIWLCCVQIPRWWSYCAVRATNNLLKSCCSYWFDNLGFFLRENLLLNCIIPSSWGLPTSVWFTPSSSFSGAVAGEVLIIIIIIILKYSPVNQAPAVFWRRCRGLRGYWQGEFHASNLFTLFLSCLVYFILSCLLSIIKNTKKLVTCI